MVSFCCLIYDRNKSAQIVTNLPCLLFELLPYEVVVAKNDGCVNRSELAADQNEPLMWFLDTKCPLISALQPGFMLPPDFP